MRSLIIIVLMVLEGVRMGVIAQNMIRIPLRNLEFHTLQDAVNASQPGDSIVVPAGTYTSDCDILIQKDSLIIQGAGKTEFLCTSKEHNVMWLQGHGIIVRNIVARHKLPEDYAHCTGNVFAVDNCTNCVIEACDINGCGRIGVYIFGSMGLILRKNKIHNNSLCAVEVNGTAVNKATDEHTEIVVFQQNRIWDNGSKSREKNKNRRLERAMRKSLRR